MSATTEYTHQTFYVTVKDPLPIKANKGDYLFIIPDPGLVDLQDMGKWNLLPINEYVGAYGIFCPMPDMDFSAWMFRSSSEYPLAGVIGEEGPTGEYPVYRTLYEYCQAK